MKKLDFSYYYSFTELAISKVFCGRAGVISFLINSINFKKLFQTENNKIFALFTKLIELHPTKVADYAVSIVDVNYSFCFRYLF